MNIESSDQPYPDRYWLATDDELAQTASYLKISLAQGDAIELDANFSRVLLLNSSGGDRRVLKIRARWMTERRIRFEHTLAKHLNDLGMPIVAPLTRERGSTWTKVGDLYCEIAPFVDGQDAGPYLAGVREMGEILGHFHEYSLSLDPNLYEPPHFQNQAEPLDLKSEAEQLLRQSSGMKAEDVERAKAICARIQELDASYQRHYASLPQVIRHGDFHPWNLLFSRAEPDKVVALFDLDMTAQGPRVFDIAYTIFFLRNLHPEVDGNEWNARYRQFIEGYTEVSGVPLREDEIAVVPMLIECIDLGFVVRAKAQEAAGEYDSYVNTVSWLQGSTLAESLGG